ncbi:MAG: ATP-binding protein [Scytolyngbya sp. HA4215-MV1]|nr:ATP-binding protein [Scytolyngbya sp. HA4215-MV1]
MTQSVLPLGPKFSGNFIYRHAGSIALNPEFAVVELVANSWDAGSEKVEITWPKAENTIFSIKDNGEGMTEEEFSSRWDSYYYERNKYQSREVLVSGSAKRKRTTFGKNGLGRHGMFCFTDEYIIETSSRKSPYLTKASVELSTADVASKPFNVKIIERKETSWHGTKISCNAIRNYELYNQQKIMELIGSKFIADPEFKISVNDEVIEFEDLESMSEVVESRILEEGCILYIKRFDTQAIGRTTKQNGIAWWVNKRLVGKAGWSGRKSSIVDGRKSFAKRFSYIIEADFLEDFIFEDWSSFKHDEKVEKAEEVAYKIIENDVQNLTKTSRRETAKNAISAHRSEIKRLSPVSRQQIAFFAEKLSDACPRIKQEDINNAIKILVDLEKTRSGYALLEKLAKLSSEGLENLDVVLGQWSIDDARKVLDELHFRLKLICQIEKLVDLKTTDELHQLQPLFLQGLWIFGPKFESKEYTSNKTLLTVVKKLLDKNFSEVELIDGGRRPDFVIIPNRESEDGPSSVGLCARSSYGENNEVNGVDSIVIVELKKGGFQVKTKEKRQAQDYAKELIKSGRVSSSTKITCYVLGSSIEKTEHEPLEEGNTIVYPLTYGTVLSQAHARTFNLINHLKNIDGDEVEFISRADDSTWKEVEDLMRETGVIEDDNPLFPNEIIGL